MGSGSSQILWKFQNIVEGALPVGFDDLQVSTAETEGLESLWKSLVGESQYWLFFVDDYSPFQKQILGLSVWPCDTCS